MFDYLHIRYMSWVFACYNTLLAPLSLREGSFEAKLEDLKKLKESQRYVGETLRDVIEASHCQTISSHADMESEDFRKGI